MKKKEKGKKKACSEIATLLSPLFLLFHLAQARTGNVCCHRCFPTTMTKCDWAETLGDEFLSTPDWQTAAGERERGWVCVRERRTAPLNTRRAQGKAKTQHVMFAVVVTLALAACLPPGNKIQALFERMKRSIDWQLEITHWCREKSAFFKHLTTLGMAM